jgi:ribonuclease PH
LGERQIIIDCDVLQADGGTRCASITGGWIALKQAVDVLLTKQLIKKSAITCNIAAISCGIYENQPILDLDYLEDSNIETDANFVMTDHFEIVEVQSSAEKKPFTRLQLDELLNLAEKGIKELVEIQNSQF